MRVADYVAKRLKIESDYAFGVTGGYVINLFDAFHKGGPKMVPMHHEQAAAMAADGYARVSGRIGVCVATAGPGVQNLVTGVACSYYDSVPVVAIGGQVPRQDMTDPSVSNVRQTGFQESNNQLIMSPVTKMSNAFSVDSFQESFGMALQEMVNDRKGPVYVEVCDDVQREEVFATFNGLFKEQRCLPDLMIIEKCLEKINNSKKPVVVIGAGVRQSGYVDEAVQWIEHAGIPVLLTWGAMDILEDSHPLNMRDFGVTSQRVGNWILSEADIVISLGARLDHHEIAKSSDIIEKTIYVDIDESECHKANYLLPVCGDMISLLSVRMVTREGWSTWAKNCFDARQLFSIYDNRKNDFFWDPYLMVKMLSCGADHNAVIISDAGQTVTWTFQAWMVKRGQRLITAFNHSPMGYALPASIGAQLAHIGPVYCIIGDGGLMMNLQELQTISSLNLPIRIIVVDNGGYGMIRQTQDDWETLNKCVCTDSKDNLMFPDLDDIAKSFNIDYMLVSPGTSPKELFRSNRPTIFHFPVCSKSKISPKLKAGRALRFQVPDISQKDTKLIHDTLNRGI